MSRSAYSRSASVSFSGSYSDSSEISESGGCEQRVSKMNETDGRYYFKPDVQAASWKAGGSSSTNILRK